MATIPACAFTLEVNTIGDTKSSVFTMIDNILFTPAFIDEIDMMYPRILKKLNINPFTQSCARFISATRKNQQIEKICTDLIFEMREERNIQGPKRTEEETEMTLEITNDIIAAQALEFYAAGYKTV
ncbi:unnamed protein product [Parnassius apollo]|uniref:(apollo) hypothetical protein n=1 Tax=Parnassius apollo TaxID=110799 RepID=A0A8S3X482_PARAO|nr:unnamed protein product [Parnassius apollo]